MMKTFVLVVIITVISAVSCSKYVSPFDQTVSQTVIGTIKDVERDRAIVNLKVYVVRTYGCGTWFAGGVCSEIMDSTLTDNQGKYTMTFPNSCIS